MEYTCAFMHAWLSCTLDSLHFSDKKKQKTKISKVIWREGNRERRKWKKMDRRYVSWSNLKITNRVENKNRIYQLTGLFYNLSIYLNWLTCDFEIWIRYLNYLNYLNFKNKIIKLLFMHIIYWLLYFLTCIICITR
jgi:hypothetical protein